jgi:hypothetical protein
MNEKGFAQQRRGKQVPCDITDLFFTSFFSHPVPKNLNQAHESDIGSQKNGFIKTHFSYEPWKKSTAD